MSIYQVIQNEGVKSLAEVSGDCTEICTDTLIKAEELLAKVEGYTPDIVVDDPIFQLPEKIIAGEDFEFTVSANPLLACTSIEKFVVSCPELSISGMEINAENNVSRCTLAIPNAQGIVLGITIYAVDTFGNISRSITKSTTTGAITVQAPVITVPSDGSTVDTSGGTLLVSTSEFKTAGDFTDTHECTDWQLASDALMESIVKQDLNSLDKLSHTFIDLNLDKGASYYLRARHKGVKAGWGEFSAISTFKCKAGLTTEGGMLVYRHPIEDGSVIEFTEPIHGLCKVLVMDAKYRFFAIYGTFGNNVPDLGDYSIYNVNNNRWINGESVPINSAIASAYTDELLNSVWKGSIDANTSKQNTDALIAFSSPLALGSRDVLLSDNTMCDFPNFQTLLRIFCCGVLIDSLDPSAGSNDRLTLSSWLNSNYVWSSTESSASGSLAVYYEGSVNSPQKINSCGVIPISELEIEYPNGK